jgi:hypothetical protein
VDEDVEGRVAIFVKCGVKPMAAVHVALAEAAGVDCFCQMGEKRLDLRLPIAAGWRL